MILKETQVIQNVGDMARFGATLFQVLAPLQLALIMFLAAISAASNVAIEKDRQTLILVLMSRLTNSELVLGKLSASLLNVSVMLMTSLPIFMLIVLFGGTSFEQVGWTYAVTFAAAFLAGSLGNLVAFWREKTFQTLAMVGIVIVFWIGVSEGVGMAQFSLVGYSADQIAATLSPIRAIIAASLPTVPQTWPTAVLPQILFSLVIGCLMCLIAIVRVRKWNPSREVRFRPQEAEFSDQVDPITGQQLLQANSAELTAGQAVLEDSPDGSAKIGRAIDAVPRQPRTGRSRHVWDNPILWREACTWAYGKKILFIRLIYWGLALSVLLALYWMISSGEATRRTADEGFQLHVVTKPLAPFLLLSVVLLNALAVTSITTERDGRALDLLRVSDISPQEFLLGKLFGVAIVAADMILIPIGFCAYLCYHEIVSVENLIYLVASLLMIYLFVGMLGVHCGMLYSASRQAILVSLGTVFFLFLGVITSMLMMISFTGNVEAQLTPFLACIIGGGIGLYVALGWNMPSSPALVTACGLLPFAMFYSITSYMLGNYLTVFIVLSVAYGFACLAMMVPRLSEFLVASDRVKGADTE